MFPDNTSNSAILFERAKNTFPGGNTRHTNFFPPHPIYAASGKGCRVTDVDGNTYVDFMNNASALIHGHSHPEIVAAIANQTRSLTSVGLPTESDIILAELLKERLPSIDHLRFCNSGTEAVMFAVKAARAFSAKPKIAKVEGAYHGSYDVAETSMDPEPDNWGDSKRPRSVAHSNGAPTGVLNDVLVLPFNDIEGSIRLLEENKNELAGILFDPLVFRMGFLQATPEYAKALRDFCDASGVLLIVDEVFSFRMGYNGAQGEIGIHGDLTTLGKFIGGGLPIGAIGGRSEVMAVFDHSSGRPKVPHGGTFNANPLTMAAGAKAIELLTQQTFSHLAELGDRARKGIKEVFRANNIDGQIMGHGSMIAILLNGAPFTNYREYLPVFSANDHFTPIHHSLINHGCLMMPGGGILLSTPMGKTEIDFLIEGFDLALKAGK